MSERFVLFGWHVGRGKGGYHDRLGTFISREEANIEGQRYVRRATQNGARADFQVCDQSIYSFPDVTSRERQGFDGWLQFPCRTFRDINFHRDDPSVYHHAWTFRWYQLDHKIVISNGQGAGDNRGPAEVLIPSLSAAPIRLLERRTEILTSLEFWPVDPLDVEFPPPAPQAPPTPLMTPSCTCQYNQNSADIHNELGCIVAGCGCAFGRVGTVEELVAAGHAAETLVEALDWLVQRFLAQRAEESADARWIREAMPPLSPPVPAVDTSGRANGTDTSNPSA